MTQELIRVVDELVVARNARIRAEEHLRRLMLLETQVAKKVERQREKMTLAGRSPVGDATMAACRV
jgi:hypothetical protein